MRALIELTRQSMANREHDRMVENKRALAKQADATSWRLFFWSGLARAHRGSDESAAAGLL